MAKNKVTFLSVVKKDDWLIQASVFKYVILVTMFNEITGKCFIQYLNNEYEANLFIEYVIEKGDL
jgi:hypothetical protein